MASNIVLILGGGPNIGYSVSRHFSSKGFKTAIVSRSMHPRAEPKPADLLIPGDLSNPEDMARIFEECRKELGIPNVVIYNAYGNPMSPEPASVPINEWVQSLNINTVSPYAAIHEAVKGWEELPKETLKTFIYTGNCCTHKVVPICASLGVGKVATATLIEHFVAAYKSRGYRFYYADERFENAAPTYRDVSGPFHAEHYYKLAMAEEQGPWESTFVGGIGYVNFEGRVGELPGGY